MLLRAGGAAALLFCAAQTGSTLSWRHIASVAPAEAQATVTLKRGTRVPLLVVREVNSELAGRGSRVELRVFRAVEVDGKVVIPEGATAWGHVVRARGSGSLGDDPEIAIELDRIELGAVAIPIQGSRMAQGEGTMPTVTSGLGVTIYTLRWTNAKVKAGELLTANVAADVTLDLPLTFAVPVPELTPRAPGARRGRKANPDGPYMIVNPDVGVPVFPYGFPSLPYTVLGEIKVGVREGNSYSPEPSQRKIYRELWERGARMGADAVINARYDDPHLSIISAMKTDATGTAIRFDVPAVIARP